jgi:hypothetical protein
MQHFVATGAAPDLQTWLLAGKAQTAKLMHNLYCCKLCTEAQSILQTCCTICVLQSVIEDSKQHTRLTVPASLLPSLSKASTAAAC